MSILRFLVLVLTLYAAAGPAAATARDGEIVSRERYRPAVGSYEALIVDLSKRWRSSERDPAFDEKQFRRYFPASRFVEMMHQRNVSFERIIYLVDGLRVPGFIVHPRRSSRKLPVLIYARGGNAAPLEPDWRADLVGWAERGYVVLATDYRGLPGNEGRDEFGGSDVNDVIALAAVAGAVPEADLDNIFLYGHSRGSIMALNALARGMQVRAAAVTGTVSDLEAISAGREDMQKVFKQFMPDYDAERSNRFCRRSAICWAEQIKTPLLIQHGGADWRSPPDQALKLANELQRHGSPYELVIYKGDDHRLGKNREAAVDRIFTWFESHKSRAGAQ